MQIEKSRLLKRLQAMYESPVFRKIHVQRLSGASTEWSGGRGLQKKS